MILFHVSLVPPFQPHDTKLIHLEVHFIMHKTQVGFNEIISYRTIIIVIKYYIIAMINYSSIIKITSLIMSLIKVPREMTWE